jgi:predicted metal-dependent enzyme (double-stranded beta helix superfamily)
VTTLLEAGTGLCSTARRLAGSPEIWQPRVRRDTGERWYALLAADRQSEAWLLGWPVGGGIELHDHGGSSGAICVVEGVLDETFVDTVNPLTADGTLRRRRLWIGALIDFGPEHIHDVVNHGSRPALSIHVYSPRLRSMTFYDHGPGTGIVPVRIDYGEGH